MIASFLCKGSVEGEMVGSKVCVISNKEKKKKNSYCSFKKINVLDV